MATMTVLNAEGLPDADITDGRERRDDGYGGNVDDRAGTYDVEITLALRKRRGGEGRRQVHPDLVEQADQVARPPNRHSGNSKQVLEYQVPTDEPRYAFAECCIGVRICTAGNGNHRGKTLRSRGPRGYNRNLQR